MNHDRRAVRPTPEPLEGKQLMTAGLGYSIAAVPVMSFGHQQIDLTLTITNTSNHAELVDLSSTLDGFVATQGGRPVWQSNAGLNPFSIRMVTLAPGKSVQVASVWNEQSNVGSLKSGTTIAGPVTFHDEMDPSDTTSVFIPVRDPIELIPFAAKSK